MEYSDFQQKVSSEKITLATLNAAKRLMGWSVYSDSVYQIPWKLAVIASIADSGVIYSAVGSIGALTNGSYYLDRSAQVLYIKTSGADNPNGRFIVATGTLFFSNVPIALPHDLDSGFEVFWEPIIKSTSQFGVEIDTINQVSEAIEGSGTLTLINDQDFWPQNFDKFVFENKDVSIWSYNRDLDDATRAKVIFKGFVLKRTYASGTVEFQLTDLFAALKANLALGTIADLNQRTGDDLAQARQRMVLGRVFGHLPVNIDQVLDGYPITGTVSIAFNSSSLSGSGTKFLTELSPDDRLVANGVEYTVSSVSTDTDLVLTEVYGDPAGLSGAQVTVLPDQPKRWINRKWNVAGHTLREPTTLTANGSGIAVLYVDDGEDFYAGDWIYVGTLGSGELVQIDQKAGNGVLFLRQSLATIPPIGTPVRRPAVQNVRIDDTSLVYYRDYTFDADTATLTLNSLAEANASPIRTLTSNLSFTSGSRTFTGSSLKDFIKPGYYIGVVGNSVFFEVLSVDSDTSGTLRTTATFSTTATGRYKPLILNPDESKLSLDTLGRTEDGTSNGRLLKTAPSIIKALLKDIGLEDQLDEDTFDDSEPIVNMHLGVAFPTSYSDSTTPIYRDMINGINKSVFGSLIQTVDFKIAFNVLQPSKPINALLLTESDILSLKFDAFGDNLIKTAIVEYQQKEYDYLSKASSLLTKQKTSDVATYLVGTLTEKTFTTYLVDDDAASLIANRWSFLQEASSGRVTIETKLQGMNLGVGSIIKVQHRKVFERFGSDTRARLFLIESVKKDGVSVEISAVDLNNTMVRVAVWNDFTPSYADADDDQIIFGGFWTDSDGYGLINNDPESFGLNLFW